MRSSIGAFGASFACLALLLAIGVSAASATPTATPTWGSRASFGASSGLFETARNGIAVDSHGNIFVADQNSEKVHIYAPDPSQGGVALTDVTVSGFIVVRNVAVDPGDDELYVDEPALFGEPHGIRRYTSDGNPTPTYSVDPSFEVPRADGFAIDPSTHNLLVADANAGGVRRYDAAGNLLATLSTPVAPTYVATVPDGSFYVASASGPDVFHLAADGTVLGTIVGAGDVRGLAWNSSQGNLVASVGSQFKIYSAAGQFLYEAPAQTGEGSGIAVDGANDLLYQSSPGPAYAYVSAVSPGVEPPVASAITPTGFHVSTEVDPGEEGGGAPAGSTIHFEYRITGDPSWIPTPDQTVSAAGDFGADIAGLEPNLPFEVRAVASNSLASRASDIVTVTTAGVAPQVVTGSATDVSETGAVLNGTLNPVGLQTTYHFEYGTSTAYGSRIPVGIEAIGGGTRETRAFSRTIGGLQPGTTYHFRLVATNSVGVSEGADRTFTTATAGGVPRRAYEQVSPVEKQGNALAQRFPFQTAADGSTIAYSTASGEANSAEFNFKIAERGSQDWQSGGDLSVPLNAISQLQNAAVASNTMAISSDFTHQFLSTNRALAPGAIEGGANLYVRDIATNSYQLVAARPNPLDLPEFVIVASWNRWFVAGAPDFSWVIFWSRLPLTEGAPEWAFYKWTRADRKLEVISDLPDGAPSSAQARTANNSPIRQVSADGSRVYFSERVNVPSSNPGIYLHEDGQPTKAISVSHIPGDPATPHPGTILGVSRDGRFAFFALQKGKLTSDAPGSAGVPETPEDIYRYDASDESLEYIGTGARNLNGLTNDQNIPLNVSDSGDTVYFIDGTTIKVWRKGVVSQAAPVEDLWAAMSPDGRYLAYEDTNNVYVYDADADQRECVSCLPDGTPANGRLPAKETGPSHDKAQYVTDNGRVFFSSTARLIQADVNGTRDVYMFQGGRPSLISPGNAAFDAELADSSANGDDVFFTTAQKLVGRDHDEETDIYDARVNGGLPAQNPPPPQECLRDDCKATPNAGPELPFGGSEALSGPGNVQAARQKKRQATRCGKGRHAVKAKGKSKVRCAKKHKANDKKKGGNR